MTTSDSYRVAAAAGVFLRGRLEAAFPTLGATELARMRRFATPRRFDDGQALFQVGQPRSGMFVVLTGHVAITVRDGLGHVMPVVEQGAGQFVAELATLSESGTSPTDGRAEGVVETLYLPSNQVRALIVEETELGERIMRALILRRMALVEYGEGGPLVIGAADSPGVVRLEEFLRRNGQPHRLLDPAVDPAAAEVMTRLSPTASELPLVVCQSGEILRNPSDAQLARAVGLVGGRLLRTVYDLAIIGAGPAGLSTAVYAASEGISVLLIDAHAFGGQAGQSARIENYFGFPTGISGLALTARAYAQARKFGAEVVIPIEVTALDCRREEGLVALLLDDGQRVRARAVVIASGARYRRPAIPDLAMFEGRGVYYWASPFEAKLCAEKEVIVVGGGNSAGQAAVFLAGQAAKVRMMVRGSGLAAGMSRYLVQRISAAANIEVLTGTELVKLAGAPDRGLERVTWKTRGDDRERGAAIAHVFLLLGADPATQWLTGCGVALDAHGFVVCGLSGSPLETTVSGVFAVGDVRAGSVKRVGSAIGEGAQVVAALHAFLAAAARG
jgi:thioredoxin reductase (NADPH)